MCFIFLLLIPLEALAAPPVEAPSYILMEASTGQIICEQNAQERRSPASITKIMTLLVIFDHLGSGRVKLDSEVMTSAYAKSMGGSQVFLEEGEVQTLETIIKCIAVASGNDASVAAAEFIAGSEQEFVNLMNKRAEEMGLTNTHFEDCCGLSESDNHYTSAEDVARMSRELITKYPQILDYTKIWMEDITHSTQQGTSNFTLSSTNKLLKMYEWTTGLKTGSTSKALYCLSATASKDNIDLIAVVMASPSNKTRFQDAMALLNYGYSVSALYEDANEEKLPAIPVKGGVQEEAPLIYKGPFRYLDIAGSDLSSIEKTISLPPEIQAPVQRGDAVGEAVYKLNGERIGSVSILSDVTIEKAGYKDYLLKLWKLYYNL
ncbi:D-alanyl-D-alanine carboxypeptidase [Lachnospiraceae bacterium]|jgi:D-alanyl-D-alanine carboxypeptidase (penicillin-binding protein 5/6)|nr:D-alanyl-D-alanine carboxypeptidase [Lachnospiraceae bacterium]